jgi:predicted acyltransferase
MKVRDTSIDALRGFAILTMVLSGSIAYGDVLPAWMFHAQVPPPLHKFNATIPGITWVDLVFPFFLFSMGAAMPLALKKYVDAKEGFIPVFKIACKRFLLLTFFALFVNHMKAWAISENSTNIDHLLSILAFVLLFFQLYENKNEQYKTVFLIAKIISFAIAIFLLWKLPFWKGKGFDFYKSDIIIMLLGNMAFFGTLIYYFTATKPNFRMGILAFIMAIFLAAKEPTDSWAKAVFQFNHIGNIYFDWVYQFYFLKYLFIVIPGTIAGDFIVQSFTQKQQEQVVQTKTNWILVFISMGLLVLNLYGLFTRNLLFNFITTSVLCTIGLLLHRFVFINELVKKMIQFGSYLLLLGLCLETYEGGIKKDVSTYSYYFVTSGLAFFMVICFSILSKQKFFNKIVQYFSANGQNPMVAYVAGNLIVLPLLSITQLKPYWTAMQQNIVMGCLKGIVFTAVVSLITIFFVKKKWFWKT